MRSHVPQSRRPLVTATTTASLGGPSRTTLRVAFRFRCASVVLTLHPGQGLARGKLGRCGCATGLWPASSLINTLAVMCGSTVHCMAFTRVSTLFIIYHTHTTDGRGHRGHRPRPEQPQLVSLLENGLLGGWHAIGRHAQYQIHVCARLAGSSCNLLPAAAGSVRTSLLPARSTHPPCPSLLPPNP
jgi:hypothetical protein